jgi:hypothetical protein
MSLTEKHLANKALCKKLLFLGIGLLFTHSLGFAQTFTIIPKGSVPKIPKYGKTTVYYTISNNSELAHTGIFLNHSQKMLPK